MSPSKTQAWYRLLLRSFPPSYRSSHGESIIGDIVEVGFRSKKAHLGESYSMMQAGLAIRVRTAHERGRMEHVVSGAVLWLGFLVGLTSSLVAFLSSYQLDRIGILEASFLARGDASHTAFPLKTLALWLLPTLVVAVMGRSPRPTRRVFSLVASATLTSVGVFAFLQVIQTRTTATTILITTALGVLLVTTILMISSRRKFMFYAAVPGLHALTTIAAVSVI